MADKKISELTAVVSLAGTELIEVVQGGVNKQTTTQEIADLAGGGTSIPFGTTAGTNTYTVTATPTVTAYADGDLFLIEVGTGSTNASTLNFDGVGAKKVYERPERQITNGDWETGRHYLVTYDSALDGGAGGFSVVGDINHERLTYRGGYDVSSNLFPSTGGSGAGGGLRTGDFWVATNSGTLGTTVTSNRDLIINIGSSNPGQTAGNWVIVSGVASVDTKIGSLASMTYRIETATHELDATDLASIAAGDQLTIRMNAAGPLDLEIPTNAVQAFAVGTIIGWEQMGAGQLTIVPDVGVTLRAPNSANKSFAQYSKGYIEKIGTNEWILSGDITV